MLQWLITCGIIPIINDRFDPHDHSLQFHKPTYGAMTDIDPTVHR